MDMEYILFMGTIMVGVSLLMGTMYLIYRRGIAIRIGAILSGCIGIAAIVSFAVGNSRRYAEYTRQRRGAHRRLA